MHSMYVCMYSVYMPYVCMYVLYVFRQQEVLNDKDSVSKRLAGEEILIEKARAQLHDILQKAQVHIHIHTDTQTDRQTYTYIATYVMTANPFRIYTLYTHTYIHTYIHRCQGCMQVSK